MGDVFSRSKRSEVMARIRSRGNERTEVAFARLLRQLGIFGWRRHKEIRVPSAVGEKVRVRPDFVFVAPRIAVFTDGCFWHGCRRHANVPSTNVSFWRRKIECNRARDQTVNRKLRLGGWRVIRVWEHELVRKNERKLRSRIQTAFKV